MKSYINFIKESANSHDDFVKILQDIIIKDDKTINGFEFNEDSRSGAFEWYNGDYIIYSTPYWDGNMDLPIDITNKNGDEIDEQFFDLIELKNVNDVNSIIKFYYEKIDEITYQLSKRTELKKDLELILKSVNSINIEGYFTIGRHNKVWSKILDPLLDDDIIDILNIINKKYSDIILANKYNI
jgi:hypothetical protein